MPVSFSGIGVNVDNRQPTTCLNERLQEISSKAFQLRKEDILSSFFEKFEAFFGILVTQGNSNFILVFEITSSCYHRFRVLSSVCRFIIS